MIVTFNVKVCKTHLKLNLRWSCFTNNWLTSEKVLNLNFLGSALLHIWIGGISRFAVSSITLIENLGMSNFSCRGSANQIVTTRLVLVSRDGFWSYDEGILETCTIKSCCNAPLLTQTQPVNLCLFLFVRLIIVFSPLIFVL